MFVNLSILPLSFISSIGFPPDGMPSGLQTIAKVFSIRALADLLQYAFDPRTSAAGLKGSDIQSLLIRTVVGVALMIRFLRAPQGEVR